MMDREKNLPDDKMVAVVLDLDKLAHVKQVAMADYRRIQTFAYAIADLTGTPRGDGPAQEELKTSLEVIQFIDALYDRAAEIYKAQRGHTSI